MYWAHQQIVCNRHQIKNAFDVINIILVTESHNVVTFSIWKSILIPHSSVPTWLDTIGDFLFALTDLKTTKNNDVTP